jgi:hypothetical protein
LPFVDTKRRAGKHSAALLRSMTTNALISDKALIDDEALIDADVWLSNLQMSYRGTIGRLPCCNEWTSRPA